MTIDEAIEYYIKAANQRAIADEENGVNDKSRWCETKFMTKKESEQIIADNRQLAEWLMELKDARKLLKLAVDGFEYIKPYTSRCDGHCNNCPFENDGWCRIDWKYADEAEKLIKGGK